MRKASMRVSQILRQRHGKPLGVRCFSDAEPKEFTDYLDSLTNYEKRGVPKGAGTDSDDGFDLARMRRLMARLGDPQSNFKAVHIAGSKGKGSTAAFLSNILRADGYSVGCYTSPHIRTIRERITIGHSGDPVSANQLNSVFRRIKPMLDEAILLENGHLTHFEVFTAVAFTLFAEENADIAVIEAGLGGARDATHILCSSGIAASVITTIGEEHLAALGGSLETVATAKSGIIKHGRPVILGGPFLPHIDRILRGKASLMYSPVVSASGAESRASIRGVCVINGRACQLSDILIKVEKDIPMFIEIPEVKMRMLGIHQLQNALTAVCTALCLRDQGWRISDESIRAGLENTYLPGRNQILSSEEAEMLGLPGTTILLDGAHTKDSAKALVDTIRMLFPTGRLALVVAMTSDKDHLSFAKEFLSGLQLEVVVSTEVDIAGAKSRMTSASMLRDKWIQACKELCIKATDNEYQDVTKSSQLGCPGKGSNETGIVAAAEESLEVSMKAANEILKRRYQNESSVIVITGSLHIVSSVLAALNR